MSDGIRLFTRTRDLHRHTDCCEVLCAEVVPIAEVDALRAERDVLIATLQSIASNTCCARCNEAALVAQDALRRIEEVTK